MVALPTALTAPSLLRDCCEWALIHTYMWLFGYFDDELDIYSFMLPRYWHASPEKHGLANWRVPEARDPDARGKVLLLLQVHLCGAHLRDRCQGPQSRAQEQSRAHRTPTGKDIETLIIVVQGFLSMHKPQAIFTLISNFCRWVSLKKCLEVSKCCGREWLKI